jgi:hypothetical protein
VNGNQSLPPALRFDKHSGLWSYVAEELAKVRHGYTLLFEDRCSLSEIARRTGYKSTNSLRRTLVNPTWKGMRAYPAEGDRTEPLVVKLPLEPLLTPEKWALAEILLAKHRTWSKATRDQRFLGAGLLLCECGRSYYFHGDTRRGYHDVYYCASRFPKGPGCGSARLRRETVDRAIERLVSDYLLDAVFLRSVFARREPAPKPDLAERERELAKLAARRRKWIEQFDQDRITKQEFEERMDAVARSTREVEARMPVAPTPPEPEIGAVIARLARSFARFAKHPFAERRATLKQVFRSILVVDGAIPEFTVSGAFLGEIAHTKPGQQSIERYWSQYRAPALPAR